LQNKEYVKKRLVNFTTRIRPRMAKMEKFAGRVQFLVVGKGAYSGSSSCAFVVFPLVSAAAALPLASAFSALDPVHPILVIR
jgi:hypothetical protein